LAKEVESVLVVNVKGIELFVTFDCQW
jgi:hypothetical protein